MNSLADPTAGSYMVVAAWECGPCDVQGRSLDDSEVTCWNCGGQVTVTARPSILVEEL